MKNNTEPSPEAGKSRGRVLFIDDEVNILKSIRRGFLYADFEVLTASGAYQGLEVLESEDVDIVVADYCMPSMDGLKLLEKVKNKHPGVNRVILSGYIEKSAAVESLARGLASTYILKPWQNREVEQKIVHILEMRERLRSTSLLRTINRMENLPSLLTIYREFLEAVQKEKSMGEISRILQKDPSVTAKLLQIANSVFYGLKSCLSVQQAVVTIGLDTLQDILLTLSVMGKTKLSRAQKQYLDEIFTVSFLINRYFPEVYKIKHGFFPKQFASVGLVSNIGKILLVQYFPQRYTGVDAHRREHPAKGFYESETELSWDGITHQDIGGYLLESWNLPSVYVEAAFFHHCPENSSPDYRETVEITGFLEELIDCVVQGGGNGADISHLSGGSIAETGPGRMVSGHSFIPEEQKQNLVQEISARINQPGFPLSLYNSDQV
ncbi:MAG: HDOD domain-containing protein [Spirochaetota bacterium]